MAAQEEAAGLAALSICESLLIALVEKGVLSVEEARDTLEDAAAAYQGATLPGEHALPHRLAGEFIERLFSQVNATGRGSGG